MGASDKLGLVNRLTAIRTFCAVVERGSFVAAARSTGLSNAAVSKNLRELEAALGVRLLNRTTRQLSVTDAGAFYHERMSALLREMDEADEVVSRLSGHLRGTLRVTAPMSLGLIAITPLVPDFLQRHPAVVLDLRMDDAQANIVAEGFDLALRGQGARSDSSLVSRRLADLDHVACAAPDHLRAVGTPGEPADLRAHACLIYTNAVRPDQWAFRRDGHRQTVRVTGPYRTNNSLALRQAALAGSGIALMPRLYVEEDLRAGRLASVLEGWEPDEQSVYAVYPPGPAVLPLVRAFIDFLAGRLRGFHPMTVPAAIGWPDGAGPMVDDAARHDGRGMVGKDATSGGSDPES